MEAGRWRGRPRWAAAPELRDVVTGAPRAALLGATNLQGTAAGNGMRAAVSLPAAQPAVCRTSDAASEPACRDDSVLMGSPQRCPPLCSRTAATAAHVLLATEVAAAQAAPGVVAASTASASVLQGSVVMPGLQQNAVSGACCRITCRHTPVLSLQIPSGRSAARAAKPNRYPLTMPWVKSTFQRPCKHETVRVKERRVWPKLCSWCSATLMLMSSTAPSAQGCDRPHRCFLRRSCSRHRRRFGSSRRRPMRNLSKPACRSSCPARASQRAPCYSADSVTLLLGAS